MSEFAQFDDIIRTIEDNDIIDSIYETIYDWIHDNPLEISQENFIIKLREGVMTITFDALCGILDSHGFSDDDLIDELEVFVYECIDIYMETIISVPRSYPPSYISLVDSPKVSNLIAISDKLERLHLANECVPLQRSMEWYQFRHNLLTATNIGKVMGSEASVNSIIYEKCTPLLAPSESTSTTVNVSSPMHWGQKYEPVTIAIYEKIYDTRVKEFGCLRHFDERLRCIGASPDGINVDPACASKFGRMIEVKNIVNREINGIPLTKYWIQMQIQMEVCDLEECDFVETRFKEYDDVNDMYNDTEHDIRGIILYFVSKHSIGSTPHYVYMPSDALIESSAVSEWTRNRQRELSDGYSLYTSIAWYLDEISVVMVPRNHVWFAAATPKILSTWTTIEIERIDGYAHRMPKQRTISDMSLADSISFPITKAGCLVLLRDHDFHHVE